MQKLAKMAILCGALAAAGCAALMRTPPVPGDTRAAVLAKFGQPTSVYAAPDGEVLEYAYGPMGQQTWMARLGPDGRLHVFEQMLTDDGFARLHIGRSNMDEVLRTVGRPAEKSALGLVDLDVWSYRYRESGVWNSMMHLHFNRSGILTKMLKAPDPMYEDKDSRPD